MKEHEARSLKSGDKVNALYRQQSSHRGKLSVDEGEELTVISQEPDGRWLFCRKADLTEGHIPISVVAHSGPSSVSTPKQGRPQSQLHAPSTRGIVPGRPASALLSSMHLPQQGNCGTYEFPGPFRVERILPEVGGVQNSPRKSWMLDDQVPVNKCEDELKLPCRDTESQRIQTATTTTAATQAGTAPNYYEDARHDSNVYENNNSEESQNASLYENEEYFCVATTDSGGGKTEDDLQVAVGDIIMHVKSHSARSTQPGRLYGECLQTMKRGYISRNCLSPASPLDLEPWYVGLRSRSEAERLLRSPDVAPNTFLVRWSTSDECLVISISGQWPNTDPIRHRKVLEEGKQIFAWKDHIFNSIVDLVRAHMTFQGEMNIGQPYNKFPLTPSPASSGGSPVLITPGGGVEETLYCSTLPTKTLENFYGSTPTVKGRNAFNNITTEKLFVSTVPTKNVENFYGSPPTVKNIPATNCTTTLSTDGKLRKGVAPSTDELKKWYIKRSKLSVGKSIGEGQFGAVKLATLKDVDMNVAMKTFKSGNMNFEDFRNEIEAMKDLRHPNLVKLLGCSEIKPGTDLFLIMEFHEHGSLKDYFLKFSSSVEKLDQLPKMRISLGVASGMQYLSSQDYIHRDLAARNVLLASDLTPRIADFGLAKYLMDGAESVLDGCMPWKWSAPEVMGGRKEWSSKCDVWSYGVFCWELYNNCKLPYDNINSSDELRKHLEIGQRLSLVSVPAPLNKALTQCWKLEKAERTDFASILKTLAKKRHT